MPPSDFSEELLPEKDFDPDKLRLILRVTLSADRKTVDPVVQEVMAVVRQMKDIDGKEDAIELAPLAAPTQSHPLCRQCPSSGGPPPSLPAPRGPRSCGRRRALPATANAIDLDQSLSREEVLRKNPMVACFGSGL